MREVCSSLFILEIKAVDAHYGTRYIFKHFYLNPLKLNDYYMYHLLQHNRALYYAHGLDLCVLYCSENRERLYFKQQ
jgi:hypothetical protein